MRNGSLAQPVLVASLEQLCGIQLIDSGPHDLEKTSLFVFEAQLAAHFRQQRRVDGQEFTHERRTRIVMMRLQVKSSSRSSINPTTALEATETQVGRLGQILVEPVVEVVEEFFPRRILDLATELPRVRQI